MVQTKRLGRSAAAWACEGGSISFYVPCRFLCCRALQLTMWTLDLTTGLYVCFLDLPKHPKQQSKKRKFKTKKRWKPTFDENGTPHLYHNILHQTFEQQQTTTLLLIEGLVLNAGKPEKLTSDFWRCTSIHTPTYLES